MKNIKKYIDFHIIGELITKKEKITMTNFYFYYFEYNDMIESYLSQKCKVDILKIQSIQRIITGILVGYEYKVIDEMMKKYVLCRHFNQYLVRLKMHFDKRNVLYDEKIFRRKFIEQTADTIENREKRQCNGWKDVGKL